VTVLITGGAGIIGTMMAEKLLADGERVVLLDLAPRRNGCLPSSSRPRSGNPPRSVSPMLA
jgi:nucleoside-diphosphate-sugar epimerase